MKIYSFRNTPARNVKTLKNSTEISLWQYPRSLKILAGGNTLRRFYQESWLGIPFTAFTGVSFFRLADPRFYSAFYEELFKRHKDWNDLPAPWLAAKKEDAKWLSRQIERLLAKRKNDNAPFRILSIGSGTGYMEWLLLQDFPEIEIYVNEPSTVGMKWTKNFIPADRIFIGLPALCLPSDIKFNLIYLSAVDYVLSGRKFIRLVENLKAQLEKDGELICLSASLLQEDSFIGSLVNALKNIIRCSLHYSGIRRQQFWGWRRTKKEYEKIFQYAGLHDVTSGELQGDSGSFWIKGTNG